MKIHEMSPNSLEELKHIEMENSDIRVYEEGKSTRNSDKAICIMNEYDTCKMIAMLGKDKYSSVIPKQIGYEKVVHRAARTLANPKMYFSKPEIVLFENCIQKIEIEYTMRSDKEKIINQAVKFTEPLVPNRVFDSTRSVIEEIFMNSMFDAPRESLKKRKSGLKGRETREILLARDAETLIISGLDLFGSLDTSRFLDRLLEVEMRGAGLVMNMNADVGGAGIGCHILFNNSSNLWLGVEAGKQTRVTCEIPLKISYKKMAEIKKGIHVINL